MSDTKKSLGYSGSALSLIASGIIIVGLFYGSSFLIPLAIALLIWNLLEAAILKLTKIRFGPAYVPRSIAMMISIALVVGAVVIVANILSSQGQEISIAAPKYAERLQGIVKNITNWLGPDISQRIKNWLSTLDFASGLPKLLGSAQYIVANLVLIALYVGFLFAESRYASAKLAALLPSVRDAKQVKNILNSVSDSIRRYIWIKTVLSLATGILSYAILRYLKVDFAETWALFIFLLNYIPTIGSILGVIFPAIIALVQFDTTTPFIVIALGLTAIQFFIGNVIEPMFMGRTLNLSSFAIILALTFWGTIWGLVGMILSVPITAMTMIVAAHIPSWRWIAVLLSKDGNIDGYMKQQT